MNGTEGHGKNGIALFLVETLQLLTIAAALEEGIVVFCIFKDALAVDARELGTVLLSAFRRNKRGLKTVPISPPAG